MLHCPHCHTPHQTLRTLLTCCPRELRRLIEALYDDRSSGAWRGLLCGNPLPPRLQRALTPDTPQEAA